MNIQNSVFYVGGSKGGVGKSLFSFALVDYLLNRNANVLLVDTDTDNPDVFKAHKDLALPNLLCRLNSLDDADGWADLLDTVQNYPDYAVVINAAARTKTSTAPSVSMAAVSFSFFMWISIIRPFKSRRFCALSFCMHIT